MEPCLSIVLSVLSVKEILLKFESIRVNIFIITTIIQSMPEYVSEAFLLISYLFIQTDIYGTH